MFALLAVVASDVPVLGDEPLVPSCTAVDVDVMVIDVVDTAVVATVVMVVVGTVVIDGIGVVIAIVASGTEEGAKSPRS